MTIWVVMNVIEGDRELGGCLEMIEGSWGGVFTCVPAHLSAHSVSYPAHPASSHRTLCLQSPSDHPHLTKGQTVNTKKWRLRII